MGNEIVEGGGAKDLRRMATETIEQDALGEAVDEDQVDRRARFAFGIRRRDLTEGLQNGGDPVNEELFFAVVRIGR